MRHCVVRVEIENTLGRRHDRSLPSGHGAGEEAREASARDRALGYADRQYGVFEEVGFNL
jgi:hypothetical protein